MPPSPPPPFDPNAYFSSSYSNGPALATAPGGGPPPNSSPSLRPPQPPMPPPKPAPSFFAISEIQVFYYGLTTSQVVALNSTTTNATQVCAAFSTSLAPPAPARLQGPPLPVGVAQAQLFAWFSGASIAPVPGDPSVNNGTTSEYVWADLSGNGRTGLLNGSGIEVLEDVRATAPRICSALLS